MPKSSSVTGPNPHAKMWYSVMPSPTNSLTTVSSFFCPPLILYAQNAQKSLLVWTCSDTEYDSVILVPLQPSMEFWQKKFLELRWTTGLPRTTKLSRKGITEAVRMSSKAGPDRWCQVPDLLWVTVPLRQTTSQILALSTRSSPTTCQDYSEVCIKRHVKQVIKSKL